MVRTYTVPADFSVTNPRFLDESSSFNIPAGDEVSAAEVSQQIYQEFSNNPIDEWSDLIGESLVPLPLPVPEVSSADSLVQPDLWQEENGSGSESGSENGSEIQAEAAVDATDLGTDEREEVAEQAIEQPQVAEVAILPTAEQHAIEAAKGRDYICSRIIRVKTSIRAIDSQISELAAELKELKKTRGDKLEMLLELSEELESACGDSLVDSSPAEKASEAPVEAPIESTEQAENTAPSDSQFDPYNPWDKWEQGDAISVVRVLVDQPPTESGVVIPAGSALETFDVEPPQDTGDSLTGIVKAFLPNSRETIVLSKRECAPMVHWIKEARVGWRIGEAPAAEAQPAAAMKSSEPLPTEERQDDSWKSISVSELKLQKSLETILVEDNSIKTIGDIAEWTRWKQLTDLKKVGEAKAEKIQEALDRFWTSWSR